jgi:putative intracellular protease/amidase
MSTTPMIPHDTHLQIGSLLFEGLDQIDLTGPLEVLSRLPNSTCRIYAKSMDPVRDISGLQLTPDEILAHAPQLDLLHVPGGFGQEPLMEDEEILNWIRQQAAGAHCVFCVCTGALLCGAAGLLRGRRATTHWTALHLLPFLGAIPVRERVVIDGNMVFAAGVTADAHYNDPCREDCNLNVPLWKLLRASTAAPTFFPPERIDYGKRQFLFVDGGVTPFLNPALIAVLTATLPQYCLAWPAGRETLHGVSVATGREIGDLHTASLLSGDQQKFTYAI